VELLDATAAGANEDRTHEEQQQMLHDCRRRLHRNALIRSIEINGTREHEEDLASDFGSNDS
jgi:hypothetical protein